MDHLMRDAIILIIALLAVSPVPMPGQAVRRPTAASRSLVAAPAPRIPFLRAVELLTRRQPGEAPRVRFEWPKVTGASAYRLRGTWAAGLQWTIHRVEYEVTNANATNWGDRLVAFDVSLPEGDHVWSVEAVTGDGSSPDDEPARTTFRLN